MKKIYIFSGLGADKRVFKYLDFSDYDATFIDWIEPEVNEPIEEYAKRLTQQIPALKPILIGLSFGGIMATEVAKHIETEKIILIASAKTKSEIPFYYRWSGALKLHKLIPTPLMKQANFFSFWLFGIKTKEDKKLLTAILNDTDPKFLKWAINAIVNWKNTSQSNNIKHIHGSADKILPMKYVNYDIEVEGGGHFMTINKSKELNQILNNLL
ncbi:MAG: alpha/beta hydrolase [Flavobacterium sp.]|nr:MAG: alpha/beta hydrolase [Flavobacterium sp.]